MEQDIEQQVLAGQSVAEEQPAQQAEASNEWTPPEYLMLGADQVPWDTAQKWLGFGKHYSQRAAELNNREKEIDSLKQQFDGFDQYKPVADFVNNDPQGASWWEHVQKQWDSRHTFDQPQEIQESLNPLHNELQTLRQELSDLKQFKSSFDQREQDQALDAEIGSIKEKFGNVDFSTVDDSGLTLEQRVINHGASKGHPGFRSAFLDYYHDELMKIGQAGQVESQAKAKQAQAKTGILGKTTTPVTQVKPTENLKGKSYEDLHEEILAELGIR
jgi:hypothetical protein